MPGTAHFAKLAVKTAGDICGVPGVPILANAIVRVIETCEKIPKQRLVSRMCLVDKANHKVSRQNIENLQKRCVSLLEFLDDEMLLGPPASERLEQAVIEANEQVESCCRVALSTHNRHGNSWSSVAWRSG